MRVTSFEELSDQGWIKRVHTTTKRISYVRPNKTIVNQRRDLSDNERDAIGHILFPGKTMVNVAPQSVTPSETPSPAPAPLSPLSPHLPSTPSTSQSTPCTSTNTTAIEPTREV